VKGYQHFAGRALTALKAIDLCRHFLRDYEVRVFAPFPEVRAEAERLALERRVNITCLPEQVPHPEILRLHGSARASVAVSMADGISTSLLEAMAMGSFPIQTNTACADEWIVDGESGFVVHAENPYQIAHRLSVALTDDGLVDRAAENWQVVGQKADRATIRDQVQQAYAAVRERHAAP
jgi:glycosyltransferase involved in cell wall biosynthesis